ncbi:queuosine salvage family protein [Geobacter sp. DSM 9736]|uniref:queuosine salvage family protein n=1 Tax=Geobacter sp. DSM 9736 TaxID=1277350 RepID=UPI000B5EC1BA|nr:queuosine salvage family protein [Geobacter sp. DSM 9736]SNB45822.1 Potential Queuosine, Q, salvage protein family [Geobacter sp. DSM 9736]
MMDHGFLEKVRTRCKAVAEQAKHVVIKHDAIPEYAASLPLSRIAMPEHHPDHHYLGHEYDTVAFFLTLDSINFGSGYFPYLRKNTDLSGYFTIATALNSYFRKAGHIPPERLERITPKQCEELLEQNASDEPVRDLMTLYAKALNDLGRYVIERFGGSFTSLVEAAGFSCDRLVGILTQMPYFNDSACYGELSVPFYKRAQIVSADLFIAFSGKKWGRFDDLERLTIFADNLVPHVLQMDGVLVYTPRLADRIVREEPIENGSPEEVEIRACAVHAVELLVAELHRNGAMVTAMGIDNLLWHRGQSPNYKSRPRHRTRCVYY